jgi:hypothetical protein
MRSTLLRPLAWAFVGVTAAACGGKVVFIEDDGQGGSGGAPGTTSVSKGTSVAQSSSVASSVSSTSSLMPSGVNLEELPSAVMGPGESSYQAEATPGTLGITLVADAGDIFTEMRVTRQTAPSGATVIGQVVPTNGAEFFWYGAVAQSTPQVSHPESFPVAQGFWEWETDFQSSELASAWRRQTNDGLFHGGVLDVNVFVPADLVSDDEILSRLAGAYTSWAGIELGEVRFFDIGAQYLSVDENNVFDLLAETSVVPTRPSLSVMLTASIEGAFEGAAGFSLGAPGAPTLPGSTMSAIVWMWIGDPFFDEIILRHEAGHFAGLFHTSEFDAGLGDAIDDTPMCNDVLAIGEGCPDYDYIMFPTGGSGAGIFSPLQERVLQGSTLYRGAYGAGEAPMAPLPAPPPPPGFVDGSRKVTDAQKAIAFERAAEHRARGRSVEAWRARFAPEAAEHLGGIGCPTGASTDFYDVLAAAGATDVEALLATAQDAGAPTYVRRRALGMAARLAPESARPIADALSVDPSVDAVLRHGAALTRARIGTP